MIKINGKYYIYNIEGIKDNTIIDCNINKKIKKRIIKKTIKKIDKNKKTKYSFYIIAELTVCLVNLLNLVIENHNRKGEKIYDYN